MMPKPEREALANRLEELLKLPGLDNETKAKGRRALRLLRKTEVLRDRIEAKRKERREKILL